jgi:hypothetical protein
MKAKTLANCYSRQSGSAPFGVKTTGFFNIGCRLKDCSGHNMNITWLLEKSEHLCAVSRCGKKSQRFNRNQVFLYSKLIVSEV